MKQFTLLIALLISLQSMGQQEWVYTMQALNLYDGNAAAAGMYERSAVHLRLRSQWLGVEGAPKTAQMSYHTALGERLGIGTRWMSERIGAFDRSRMLVHGSWRTQLGNGELAFALGGGVTYERFARERVSALHIDDPALLGGFDQWAPVVSAAVMFRNKHFFVGLEGLQSLIDESNWGQLTGTGSEHEALLMAGSNHQLNDAWSFRPMLAMRYAASGAWMPELQAGFWYRKTLWFGAGYRHETAAYAFAEYRFLRKYRFAYSFGWPATLQAPATAAHHEVMLGVFWGKRQRKSTQSMRYFQ